jgi:hypothetical protein
MIIFCPELRIMISDMPGYEGSNELRQIAKQMRLDKAHCVSEGHPTDEYWRVPEAKCPGMSARGATYRSHVEIHTLQSQKREKLLDLSKNTSKMPQNEKNDVSEEVFETKDRDMRHNRRFRDERRRQKEGID